MKKKWKSKQYKLQKDAEIFSNIRYALVKYINLGVEITVFIYKDF